MISEAVISCFTFLPALMLFVFNRRLALELIADIRLGRILHYFILFLFGLTLSAGSPDAVAEIPPATWWKAALYFAALLYAAVFAIVTNNREDLATDRITNPGRPLVKGTVDPEQYLLIARLSLLVGLVIAGVTGTVFFIAIAAISLIYFVYSCKPFKLKRFVLLAKFLIGLNSLVSALCGFAAAGGRVEDFPLFWLFFILVPVSLMANFVDLKDTAGDRIAGVRTLPVLLGDGPAKYLIGGFTLLAYALVLNHFGSLWIVLAVLPVCTVHLFLLLRRTYLEKPLFLLHNSLFLGLIALLLTHNLFR